MDVLNRAESLLPQLEFDRYVQLLEPGIEMALQRLRVAEIDGMGLSVILRCVLEMIP